jgi:hypothetical protein
MRSLVERLNALGVKTLACCCGHGIYYPSIVVEAEEEVLELYSGAVIPRKKRFYRRDKVGVFFIPEAQPTSSLN